MVKFENYDCFEHISRLVLTSRAKTFDKLAQGTYIKVPIKSYVHSISGIFGLFFSLKNQDFDG